MAVCRDDWLSVGLTPLSQKTVQKPYLAPPPISVVGWVIREDTVPPPVRSILRRWPLTLRVPGARRWPRAGGAGGLTERGLGAGALLTSLSCCDHSVRWYTVEPGRSPGPFCSETLVHARGEKPGVCAVNGSHGRPVLTKAYSAPGVPLDKLRPQE